MTQQQPMTRPARRFVGVATILALSIFSRSTLASPDWDIVGIRLGMTEAEARAAILAHSAEAQLSEQGMQFTFSDGAKQMETPAFLASISADIPNSNNSSDSEGIELDFSPPPLEQRVIRVHRTMSLYGDPPALDRVLGSLTQKCGEPRSFETLGIGEKIANSTWAESGKALCGDDQRFFITVDQSPDGLRLFHQLQQEKLAPADLSECGAQMRASARYREGARPSTRWRSK